MPNIKIFLQNRYLTKNAMKTLNLQVCLYGNVALYDTKLVYTEIASSLLSWALRCALWTSNLRQYFLLGWFFFAIKNR